MKVNEKIKSILNTDANRHSHINRTKYINNLSDSSIHDMKSKRIISTNSALSSEELLTNENNSIEFKHAIE